MGYICHNAIVVTCYDEKTIHEAESFATNVGLCVVGPSDRMVNGYRSFLVCPDGSKEDWTESAVGDERRDQFKKWLYAQQDEDGYGNLEWVEISYGNDDEKAEIVATAWDESDEEAVKNAVQAITAALTSSEPTIEALQDRLKQMDNGVEDCAPVMNAINALKSPEPAQERKLQDMLAHTQPIPSDFGIPDEYRDKAKAYANYYAHHNKPETAQQDEQFDIWFSNAVNNAHISARDMPHTVVKKLRTALQARASVQQNYTHADVCEIFTKGYSQGLSQRNEASVQQETASKPDIAAWMADQYIPGSGGLLDEDKWITEAMMFDPTGIDGFKNVVPLTRLSSAQTCNDQPLHQYVAQVMTIMRAAWTGDTEMATAYANLMAEKMEKDGLDAKWLRQHIEVLNGEREAVYIKPADAAQTCKPLGISPGCLLHCHTECMWFGSGPCPHKNAAEQVQEKKHD